MVSSKKTVQQFWRSLFMILVIVVVTMQLAYMNLAAVPTCPGVVFEPELVAQADNGTTKQQHKTTTSFTEVSTVNAFLPHCNIMKSAMFTGYRRKYKGYMTVGISSIHRPNTTDGLGYLEKTLKSLITNLEEHQKKDVAILIFLSDLDDSFNSIRIETLKKLFEAELASGLLVLFKMPYFCYPQLDNLPRTYNDKAVRVKWRSKQVVDYAFLWKIASNMSSYYMQLEDDVVTVPKYLSHIQSFVHSQKKQWTVLEFSKLGYIGKLYKSEDLFRLAEFVLTFYYHQPIDWLFGYYTKLMTQTKPIYRTPYLFQHIGKQSSLLGTENDLEEEEFAGNPNKTKKAKPKKNKPK